MMLRVKISIKQLLLWLMILLIFNVCSPSFLSSIMSGKINRMTAIKGGAYEVSRYSNMDIEPPRYSLGKDKEVQFSIDLKWLCSQLSDKRMWISLSQTIAEKIKCLYPPYQNERKYREEAIRIIRMIRRADLSTESKLK